MESYWRNSHIGANVFLIVTNGDLSVKIMYLLLLVGCFSLSGCGDTEPSLEELNKQLAKNEAEISKYESNSDNAPVTIQYLKDKSEKLKIEMGKKQ
ncbi:hypothetical protein CBW53_03020 [Yersinia frederiksenii]|nr:hypothetical protein CBW53_03020 [Yersinia frederiksenii]